jgi:hypothetical protein
MGLSRAPGGSALNRVMVMLLQIRGLGCRRGAGDHAFPVDLPAPDLARGELIGSFAAGAVLATHEQARVEGLGLRAFQARPRERGAGYGSRFVTA